MKGEPQIVISASRRTDIPAFYMDRFMARISAGSFRVENPYNRKVSTVPATPDAVHSIVFWSKDYGPFLNGGYGPALKAAGYSLFFNFTINAEDSCLEPNVPPLRERFYQLADLCRLSGPRAVSWRFDPICFYRMAGGEIHNNLEGFAAIAEKADAVGIRRCITSFMDHYAKVCKRAAGRSALEFIDPSLKEKAAILTRLAADLGGTQISLKTCCEKEVLTALPPGHTIAASACIPSDLLVDLFGGGASRKPDRGQRTVQGCGCGVSVDVGSYRRHPCFHNCLFCYANPREPGLDPHENRPDFI